MRIDPASINAQTAAPVPAPKPAPSPVRVPTAPSGTTPAGGWTNPAAAAALRSSVDMLRVIEDGIIRNFGSVERVRYYASDLKSTMEILDTATSAITNDDSKENDSFLPLINSAGGGVTHAEARLVSKELAATWPIERTDILSAIRRAKAISQNVADQLDPRSPLPLSRA